MNGTDLSPEFKFGLRTKVDVADRRDDFSVGVVPLCLPRQHFGQSPVIVPTDFIPQFSNALKSVETDSNPYGFKL
jgi:hypothetical protein